MRCVFTIAFSYGLNHIDHLFTDEAQFVLDGVERACLRLPLRGLLRPRLIHAVLDCAHGIQQLAQDGGDFVGPFGGLLACLLDQIGDLPGHRVDAGHQLLAAGHIVPFMRLGCFLQLSALRLPRLHHADHAFQLLPVPVDLIALCDELIALIHQRAEQLVRVVQGRLERIGGLATCEHIEQCHQHHCNQRHHHRRNREVDHWSGQCADKSFFAWHMYLQSVHL